MRKENKALEDIFSWLLLFYTFEGVDDFDFDVLERIDDLDLDILERIDDLDLAAGVLESIHDLDVGILESVHDLDLDVLKRIDDLDLAIERVSLAVFGDRTVVLVDLDIRGHRAQGGVNTEEEEKNSFHMPKCLIFGRKGTAFFADMQINYILFEKKCPNACIYAKFVVSLHAQMIIE